MLNPTPPTHTRKQIYGESAEIPGIGLDVVFAVMRYESP